MTALAVAIGVTAVMTLGVLTYSLRQTAVSILKTGNADFTVSQRGVSDILDSSLDRQDIEAIRRTPGVESAIGTFVATGRINAEHPFFIEVGIRKADEAPYGITMLAGRSFSDTARNEMMLGWRAAKDFGVGVGDKFKVEERTFRSSASSRPRSPSATRWACSRSSTSGPGIACPASTRSPLPLYDRTRTSRRSVTQSRSATRSWRPRSASDYGKVDRNLVLITAANVGGSILALFIGATGVMNTSLLSFFERIREFGLLRAVGWSRRRLFRLVLGEALLVSLVGAGDRDRHRFRRGARAHARLPQLRGVFRPAYDSMIFARALGFAFGMALLGALYPAVRRPA